MKWLTTQGTVLLGIKKLSQNPARNSSTGS